MFSKVVTRFGKYVFFDKQHIEGLIACCIKLDDYSLKLVEFDSGFRFRGEALNKVYQFVAEFLVNKLEVLEYVIIFKPVFHILEQKLIQVSAFGEFLVCKPCHQAFVVNPDRNSLSLNKLLEEHLVR